MNKQEQQLKAINTLGNNGKLIAQSKSSYRIYIPDNVVIFNANIASKNADKIWYGDIDLTISEGVLKELYNKLGEDIYILYEHDMRFENEGATLENVLNTASTYYVYNGNQLIEKGRKV